MLIGRPAGGLVVVVSLVPWYNKDEQGRYYDGVQAPYRRLCRFVGEQDEPEKTPFVRGSVEKTRNVS